MTNTLLERNKCQQKLKEYWWDCQLSEASYFLAAPYFSHERWDCHLSELTSKLWLAYSIRDIDNPQFYNFASLNFQFLSMKIVILRDEWPTDCWKMISRFFGRIKYSLLYFKIQKIITKFNIWKISLESTSLTCAMWVDTCTSLVLSFLDCIKNY